METPAEFHDSNYFLLWPCVAAGRFASGQQGANEVTAQHSILRGLHQALQSAIGDEFLSYHHVKGHSACVWNDIADAAAKLCLRQVRFHKRQAFDLRKWTPVIPHLWLLFGHRPGFPSLHPDGLAVPPPDLPSTRGPDIPPFPVTYVNEKQGLPCHLSLGAASANVLTLGGGDTGFVGKTHYLQDQFASYGFAIVGIQEARSKEGMIVGKGPYYRLCSGHQSGHHGVEL